MLTEAEVKNAKAAGKAYKLTDGGQMYLYISAAGGKSWRLDASINDRRATLTLGKYPAMTLRQARQAADRARELIEQGIDPREEKKRIQAQAQAEEQRQARTFEVVGREWHATMTLNNSPISREQKLKRLENYIFPVIGNIPITDLEPKDILQAIKPVEQRGKLEQAHRLLCLVAQVCRYARASDYVKYNPAADLSEALAPTPKAKPRAALLDPAEVAALLRAIDGYPGYAPTKYALKLLPYVFVRSQEIRGMRWHEIDFRRGLWTIPGDRMKVKTQHIVPLAKQAIAILREIEPWTGQGDLVFPSPQSKAKMITPEGLLQALRRLGYSDEEMSIHGFRSIASTFLNEAGAYRPDVIEAQLAHAERNKVRAAYNRTDYLEERQCMMQDWGDYLDTLRAGKVQTMKEWLAEKMEQEAGKR